MVNSEVFAKVAREAAIRQLPTITVFYDDVFRLPKINTLYFSKQYLVPKPQSTIKINPAEAGVNNPNDTKGDVVTVNWNLQTYEQSFTENNIQLESLDVKDYLASMSEGTNKQLAKDLDKVVLDRIKAAATEITASSVWFDGSDTDTNQVENDIVKSLDEMSKSPFWLPDLMKNTVLYLPQNMSIAMKKKVNDFNVNVPIEQLVKNYIGEVKYTPALENEAILMVKNDEYGAILVEHKSSPNTFLNQGPLKTRYYIGVTMDVQVVPEDKTTGKTKRIIKINNIE